MTQSESCYMTFVILERAGQVTAVESERADARERGTSRSEP